MSSGIPTLPEAEAVVQRAKLREALKAEFRKLIPSVVKDQWYYYIHLFQFICCRLLIIKF